MSMKPLRTQAMIASSSMYEMSAKKRALTERLWVRGASDPFVREEMASRFSTRFERAALATVGEAGRWPHAEQSAEIARLVLIFVEQLGLSSSAADASADDWSSVFTKRCAAFDQALATDAVLEGLP
jgi:hypothetical protein